LSEESLPELDRNGIRTERRDLASGVVVGGGRFGVGALSYFLKKRFYIGEVAYRGEIHAGEQAHSSWPSHRS
jgi:site-specific DNA recombinase